MEAKDRISQELEVNTVVFGPLGGEKEAKVKEFVSSFLKTACYIFKGSGLKLFCEKPIYGNIEAGPVQCFPKKMQGGSLGPLNMFFSWIGLSC